MSRPPLTGVSLFLVILALGLAAFIDGLDFAIANVAIPNIAATFGNSPQQGTWVITLFAVSNAILLALTGWLALRFGSVKVTIVALSIFTLASLGCGLAWSFTSLLVFRIIQGIGGGPLMTLTLSLGLENSPPDKRTFITSLIMISVVLAPVIGPFIGGWITEEYGWPWIFLINVPVGFVLVFTLWMLLGNRETKTVKMPVDVVGIILLVIGVGVLQVFLDRGNDADWFGSDEIIVLAIISGLGIIFFIAWNLCSDYPLIDFSFFKNRTFTMATLLAALPYIVIGGTTILIPLWVQTQKGYTPLWAGIAVMPMGILPIFISPLLGLLSSYFSLRIIAASGFMVFAFTSFWFSTFTSEVSLSQLMWPRFFQGAGIALCFLPLFQLAISSVKDEDIPKATGIHNFIRTVLGGAGISTALYVSAWTRRAALHHSDLNEALHPLRTPTVEAYDVLRDVGINDQQSPFIFDALIMQQSYVMSFNDLLWLSGWLLLMFIPFLWLCQEPKIKRKVTVME